MKTTIIRSNKTMWIALVAVALMAAACAKQPDLKPMAEKAAKTLPTELAGVGATSGIAVADNGADVVINATFDETLVKYLASDSADLSALKKVVVYDLLDKGGDNARALLQQIGNRQSTLQIKDTKNAEAAFSITGQEIKDCTGEVGRMSKADRAKTALQALAQVDKAGVPVNIDKDVTLVDVALDQDAKLLTLSFTYNEGKVNLKTSGDAAAMMQNYMAGLYKPVHKSGMEFNYGLASIAGSAADAGYDVQHKVKGTVTGNSLEFTYKSGLMGNYVKGLQ